MKRVAGWWCPELLSGPGNYQRRWEALAVALDGLVLGWRVGRVAVQAGGHIGVVPVGLSKLYARVYSFEPDADNFACLVRNATAAVDTGVFALRAALGNDRGCVGLVRSERSTGQHQVHGAGAVPVLRIDDLALDACDALLLDVEGSEIAALTGAHQTLLRYRPLVVAEENKRCRSFGHQIGDLEVHMRLFGYRLVGRCDEDMIFLPSAT